MMRTVARGVSRVALVCFFLPLCPPGLKIPPTGTGPLHCTKPPTHNDFFLTMSSTSPHFFFFPPKIFCFVFFFLPQGSRQFSATVVARQPVYYTKSHEWVNIEGSNATLGITQFAQEELGEVVYVDLPEVGDDVTASMHRVLKKIKKPIKTITQNS